MLAPLTFATSPKRYLLKICVFSLNLDSKATAGVSAQKSGCVHDFICKQVSSERLQVLLRFQWVLEVMRGQSTHMELSLEGLATSVMGGLQDELFNLTLDNIQVSTSVLRLVT